MHKHSVTLRVLALALPLSLAAVPALQAAPQNKAAPAAANKSSVPVVPPGFPADATAHPAAERRRPRLSCPSATRARR